jgi:uridine kinase
MGSIFKKGVSESRMSRKPYLVGIVGGSASGKTSFLRELAARLTPCAVVSQDNYYRPFEEQFRDAAGFANFDLPTAIHRDRLADDLQRLLRGEAVIGAEYGFKHPEPPRKPLRIEPAPVILAEGLFLFHCAEIRALIDLRVFIDAHPDTCKQRRILRDEGERGSPPAHVEYVWENHVVPAYRQYVLPYRDQAHLIVSNEMTFEHGLAIVVQRVQNDSGPEA